MDRGMSISELSRRTGLSRVTIADIENGKSDPKVKTALKICKALNEDPNDIFFNVIVNQELQSKQ